MQRQCMFDLNFICCVRVFVFVLPHYRNHTTQATTLQSWTTREKVLARNMDRTFNPWCLHTELGQESMESNLTSAKEVHVEHTQKRKILPNPTSKQIRPGLNLTLCAGVGWQAQAILNTPAKKPTLTHAVRHPSLSVHGLPQYASCRKSSWRPAAHPGFSKPSWCAVFCFVYCWPDWLVFSVSVRLCSICGYSFWFVSHLFCFRFGSGSLNFKLKNDQSTLPCELSFFRKGTPRTISLSCYRQSMLTKTQITQTEKQKTTKTNQRPNTNNQKP